jgi:hypothetical protein
MPSEGEAFEEGGSAHPDPEEPVPPLPRWLALGYESPEEFEDEHDVGPRGRTRSRFMRQVNIRLRRDRYEDLEQLARDRGISPSAMARIIVNLAVVEERWGVNGAETRLKSNRI